MNPNEYLLKFFAELERLVDGHSSRSAAYNWKQRKLITSGIHLGASGFRSGISRPLSCQVGRSMLESA